MYHKNKQIELTDFLHAGSNSHILKGDWLGEWASFGCGQFGDGTLKLTVFEEWIDGKNWYLASCCRFRKTKSWSNLSWVCMIKSECGKPGHGPLTLTVSQKWMDGINWFFHAGTNSGKQNIESIIFGWLQWKMTIVF